MNIKDVRLRKGMSRDEVNELIGEWLTLEDDVYLGSNYKHNWRCMCGDIFTRVWNNINSNNRIDCGCIEYNKQEQRYKYEVEKDGEYEYIKSFRKGDKLPNGRIVKDHTYIQIKHGYCGSIYEITYSRFINERNRCSKCCGSYENSFAYYIEQELGESLDRHWNFDKNTVNPYHIYKNYTKSKVWFKCTKTDYHGSYQLTCHSFLNGRRCGYCGNQKTHPLDSFGYHNFDKVQSWHPDNDISPFKVAPGSNKKYKFICTECGYEWTTQIRVISDGKWCPQCASSKGEKEINSWLRLNNIEFTPQKEFDGLLGLGGGNLSYDFYLPDYNLLIEYQGEYHDGSVSHQTDDELERQQEHDRRKREYVKKNNINLLEIWYWEFDNIEEILYKQIKCKINLRDVKNIA